jgi:hypothetical protein
LDLARRPTRRGGAGQPAAKAEQSVIVDLLEMSTR